MHGGWLEPLRPLCENACSSAGSRYRTEVVLFYLARWCQKKARSPEPVLESFGEDALSDAAGRIVHHLGQDGARFERLVAHPGDAAAWTELRREVLASARSRVPEAAALEATGDALGKIAEVLLTGTSPVQAAARLAAGPDGPGNEYVFDSPLTSWARTVVINLIRDRWREQARRGRVEESKGATLSRELVRQARDALPHLLQAIRELPPKQRAVMSLSLHRRQLDEAVRERLHELAPDLFRDAGPLVASDDDIAARLGSTRRRIAANRSAARRKLAMRDRAWELLLDLMLPHRSTRPIDAESEG